MKFVQKTVFDQRNLRIGLQIYLRKAHFFERKADSEKSVSRKEQKFLLPNQVAKRKQRKKPIALPKIT